MGRYSHVLGSLIGYDLAFDATPDEFNWSSLQAFLKAKLGELLYPLHCFFNYLADVFNSLFPPETRSETLLNILAFTVKILLVILVVYLLFKCLVCCCPCLFVCCRRLFCCRGRSGYNLLTLMKAPGRPGNFMPRSMFEANPRSYFLGLRANRPLFA